MVEYVLNRYVLGPYVIGHTLLISTLRVLRYGSFVFDQYVMCGAFWVRTFCSKYIIGGNLLTHIKQLLFLIIRMKDRHISIIEQSEFNSLSNYCCGYDSAKPNIFNTEINS